MRLARASAAATAAFLVKAVGSRRGRAMLSVLGAMTIIASPALGFFTATGSATASSLVGALNAPSISAATGGAGTVTLSWTAVSPPIGSTAVKYYVRRGGAAAAGNCPTSTAPSTATTCTDSGLSRGSYTYTVTAVWQSWSATSTGRAASVASGAAAQIVLSGATGNLSSGTTRTLTATVEDAAGNTVTSGSDSSATITFSQTAGSGTVTGTGAASASAGVATKTITGAGAGTITLAASATINSTPTTSNTLSFNVVAGSPATVSVASGGGQSTTVGTAFGSPLVALVADSAGNPVAGVTVTFTAPSSGASGTFANSTVTTTATTGSDGKATASTLTANTTAGGYSVTASATGASSGSFSLTNVAGSASKLVFTAQPASGANIQATGTGTFSVSVGVQDTYGNTRSADNSTTVTLAINNNPSGGTLSCSGGLGPTTVSSGIATFTGCAITKTGTSYTLTATSSSLTPPANANQFNITPGAASKLAFTQQPSNSTGGIAFPTQPKVTVQDQNGNTVTSDSSSVTLAIATNPGGGTLSCTSNPVAASSGIATFSGCSVDKAANGYTLSATDGSLTSATSATFNITVGAAAKLAFTQQPNGAQAGIAFGTQPKVAVEDAGGNIVTTDSSTVTLAIGTNPGAGTLSGCTGVKSSGVTTFSGCAISAGAAGYTLTATDGALASATSNPFAVFGYSRAAGGSATSGTSVATSTSFALSANTAYVVFAFSDSGTTGDSVTVSASGFTTNPTVNAIGSASYDSKDIEWAGYLSGGSGTGSLTARFAKTTTRAYIQVIAVKGATTGNPIAQNAFASMTGTTASNPATANLSSAPDASNGELIYWTSDQNVATPTSSSSSISFLTGTSTAATSGSQSVFGGAPPQQTESLSMGASRTWGTIALEINHG